MKDILQFLAQAGETVDNYTVPAMGKVTRVALLILDTNSIFSGLQKSTHSHSHSKSKSKSHCSNDKKQKHHAHWMSSSEEDLDESSDDESSNDDRKYSSRTKTSKRLRARRQVESSSEDDDDSYSSDADSESETSDYYAKKSHMSRKHRCQSKQDKHRVKHTREYKYKGSNHDAKPTKGEMDALGDCFERMALKTQLDSSGKMNLAQVTDELEESMIREVQQLNAETENNKQAIHALQQNQNGTIPQPNSWYSGNPNRMP
jgi:hypothetical protein